MTDFIATIIVLLLFLTIYFIPSFMADHYDHRDKLGIVLLNLTWGWTLIGWVMAYKWARTGRRFPRAY